MVGKNMGEEQDHDLFDLKDRENNCHICNISSNTSRRKFAHCFKCPSIICKPCVENTGAYWSSVCRQRNWTCQKCLGTCACKKCYTPVVVYSDLRKRSRREYSDGKSDSSSSPSDDCSENSNDESESVDLSSTKKRKITEFDKDAENEDITDLKTDQNDDGLDLDYVKELVAKNQQCIQYLTRTERLLALIRRQQKNIEQDIAKLAQNYPNSKIEALLSTSQLSTELE